LARYQGRYASICGAADDFGRCRSQFHDASCAHVQEAGASYGATPEDSQGWRTALARRAGQPAADSHDRIFLDQHGRPVTMAGHIEAATGERLGESPFYQGGSKRRELTAPQRQAVLADPSADDPSGAEFPHATRATAAAVIARHLPRAAPHDVRFDRDMTRMDPRRQADMARRASAGQRRDDARAPRAAPSARPAQQCHGACR